MPEQTINITLSEADAEIFLGVLGAKRHKAGSQAACDAVRERRDLRLTHADA